MARIMRRKAPQHENGGSMDKVKLSKDKKEDIKTLTFLNLMKVLKQKNMYPKFRASVAVTPYSGKNGNGISSIYYDLKSFSYIIKRQGENPFMNCLNYKQLLEIIDNYMNPPMVDNGDEQTITQIYITECINSILHSCLERHVGRDIKILEEIGQETFNITCKKLYGEGFEDKTASMMPPQAKQMQDMLKSINLDGLSKEEQMKYFMDSIEAFRNSMIKNREYTQNGEYIEMPKPSRYYDDGLYDLHFIDDYDL